MATDHQLNYDPTNPTPQGLPPLPKPDTHCLDDDTQRDVWSYSAELVQSYAREALAAQAATIEAICKIIECAGPEAADEIADLLGYPSVEWPSDQAASVEPVAIVGDVYTLHWIGSGPIAPIIERHGIKVGTKLYAGAPPSPASVQNASLVEKLAKRTCEANADSARFTIALQTLRASLDPDDWMGAVTMHNYIDAVLAGGSPLQQHPAPSPAQAVDAVDEREAGHVGDTRFEGWLSESVHKGSMYLKQDMRDSYWAGYQERAALQASRQPQAQQAVAEGAGDGLRQTLIDVGRVIAWQCFGDCRAYDEFGPGSLRGLHEMDAEIRAALATKEHRS